MYRLSILILHDEDAARDIVHDVFEALLVCNLTDATGAYLLKATRNRCLNHIRNLSARERMKCMYALYECEISDEDWPDDETITKIHHTIANDLSEACRQVVELRFSQNMSYKQISSRLKISETAVYKHLRHAIDVLRQKFSQNG
ncbi:MAG: sigma-70 family RNA polymerase sigma factor [Staphylococcus sp.]|nr:sigma-70 family RNA polymerase sigma factor [Staphylococcus sp.]